MTLLCTRITPFRCQTDAFNSLEYAFAMVQKGRLCLFIKKFFLPCLMRVSILRENWGSIKYRNTLPYWAKNTKIHSFGFLVFPKIYNIDQLCKILKGKKPFLIKILFKLMISERHTKENGPNNLVKLRKIDVSRIFWTEIPPF